MGGAKWTTTEPKQELHHIAVVEEPMFENCVLSRRVKAADWEKNYLWALNTAKRLVNYERADPSLSQTSWPCFRGSTRADVTIMRFGEDDSFVEILEKAV